MKTQELDFDAWCDEIDRLCRQLHGFEVDYTKESGRDAWRGHYDDGLTPDDALTEDRGYWD